MVAFIERLADATGLPVGIKSAVGQRAFWAELADEMVEYGDSGMSVIEMSHRSAEYEAIHYDTIDRLTEFGKRLSRMPPAHHR